MKNLPFLLPEKTAKSAGAFFRYNGYMMSRTLPMVKEEIMQADLKVTAEEYFAIAIFSALVMSVISFAAGFVIGLVIAQLFTALIVAAVVALTVYGMTMFYAIIFPKLMVQRKIKLLDKDLLFSLKYMLIKIKSGVPLYDVMVSISQGDYGEVSNEFRKAVKEIATGTEDIVALENMALRAPSTFFRRTIWQLTNNLRAGSNIEDILSSITSTLVREQKILIRKYGSELNPVILMYMMFAIIIPSLSITVMIVMSSFSGLKFPIFVFYIIPAIIFVMQIFFTRIIKDKKPMLSLTGG